MTPERLAVTTQRVAQHPDRRLTRFGARELYDLLNEVAIGLRYSSALDETAECWAIWEHGKPNLHDHDVEPIDETVPVLKRVLPTLGFNAR